MFESSAGGRFLYGHAQELAASKTNDFDDISNGRFLKRDGKLVRVARLVDEANEAWARLRARVRID